MISWLHRVARVRPGVSRLLQAELCAEALCTGDKLAHISIGQLPAQEPAAEWAATSAPTEANVVTFAAHCPCGVPSAGNVRGFMIDAWTERVPSAVESTSVAFHYDAPGNCAPQSILLAVTPDPNKAWDLDTLESIVRETLDLAKIRAVDFDSLQELGRFLPALYFAYNSRNDTIGVDFASPEN